MQTKTKGITSTPRSPRAVGARCVAAFCASGVLGFAGAPSSRADSAPVQIPRDEAPHNVGLEWWYVTGHLTGKDPSGKVHNYGYQWTFFRSGIGTFPVASVYVGNAAVTDLNRGTHEEDVRLNVQPDVLLPGGGYDIQLFDWNMAGKNGAASISGGFSTLDYGLKLSMYQSLPVVLNGDAGVMPPNASGSLDYYSFPSMQVAGTVIDHGVPVAVTGTSWFDHEYGAPSTVPTGWNWYAVELSDGTKYNVSILTDQNGHDTDAYGTYIAADGSYAKIDPSTLSDAPAGPSWTSPTTGIRYSTEQILNVPGGQLTVTSLVADQEMTLLGPNLGGLAALGIPDTIYSESDSTVTGTINGKPVSGVAYLEIKAYSQL